jgi:peroxiredoxin
MSPRVALDKPAPDFELDDFNGVPRRLSDLVRQKLVVLVFNRTFL